MFKHFAGTAMVASLAGGCATLPQSTGEEGISEDTVIRAVQAELACVRKNHKLKMDRYGFLLDLDLKLVNDTGVGANAVLVLPQAPEIVSASFTLRQTGRATRQSVSSIAIYPKKLKDGDCLPVDSGLGLEAPAGLGVKAWADAMFSALKSNDAADLATGSYEIEFILTRTAGGSIGVVAHRITGAGADIGGTRATTHRLKIAASAIPLKTSDIVKVEISKWPAAGTPPMLQPQSERPRADQPLGTPSRPSTTPGRGRSAPSGGYSSDTLNELRDVLDRNRPLRLETR